MHRRFCPSNTGILQSKQSTSSYTNFPFQRQSQNSWVACSHMLAQIVWPFTKLCTHFILFLVTFSSEKFLQVHTLPVYTMSFKIRIKIDQITVPFSLQSHSFPTHTILFLISFASVQKSEQTVLNYQIKTFPFSLLWTQCPSTTCPLFLNPEPKNVVVFLIPANSIVAYH